MRTFRMPHSVIGRFTFRHSVRGALIMALIFSALICSRALIFHTSYPTPEARAAFVTLGETNVGARIIFTTPRQVDTVTGYVAWNTLSLVTLIGAIWAILLATKFFRGEEEAGHTEALLAGQVTRRGAALNILGGLGANVLVVFAVLGILFMHVGNMDEVHIARSAVLFFTLAVTSSMAMFLSIGAFVSQLMPTRARALGLSAAIVGVSYALRVIADTTSLHWLLNITPLGWIVRLHPLYDSQPLWLIPILSLTAILAAATIYIAGRRDLGASLLADNDTARPHLGLLGTPLAITLRLTRATSTGWLIIIAITAALFGVLTRSAVQAFEANPNAGHLIERVSGADTSMGATAFLGIAFLLLMTLGMFYAANAIARIRGEEAEGYLDNLLVRSVSRSRWLIGRIVFMGVTILVTGLAAGVVTWVAAAAVDVTLSFSTLMAAGLNVTAPALLLLGIGVAAFGITPRFTTVVTYSVAAWSFLLEMIGSGSSLNHWLLDTSILHHMALAPAASPRWGIVALYAGLGLALSLAGLYRFNRRDIEKDN